MRTFTIVSCLACILCFQVKGEGALSTGALKRFLALKAPSNQQALSDVYWSMVEIDQNIKADSEYDISVIIKWRDKVEQVLKAPKMRPFLSAAHLDKTEVIDFDGLARSIWFPEDFRFTAEDKKLLTLLKASASKQTKD